MPLVWHEWNNFLNFEARFVSRRFWMAGYVLHNFQDYEMERETLAALADFSAGCFFASLLASCAVLYMVRRKSRLHALAVGLFGWLALMNVVLFVLIYVRNVLGEHFAPVANLYQATCIPMCVCLLYEMARPGRLTRRAFCLHIIPPFAVLFLYALTLSHALYVAGMGALACYGLLGILWAGVELCRYNRSIRQWSSNTEGVDVSWVFYILAALFLLYVVWTVASYCGVKWVNALYNFSCRAIFTSIACCLRTHEVVVCGDAGEDEARPTEACADAQPSYHFAEELHRAFEEEKIFLNPRLTINLLAERLGTNRTYLSAYINQELNVSFFEYVNRYRIAYAKQLLTSQEYTLEVVASMCGYNSLSAFRRTFSAEAGMTPGQYRKAHAGEVTCDG